MTAAVEPRLVPVLQLLAVGVAAALVLVGPAAVGLVALLALAVVWPPAVPWRPVRGVAVLRAYLPFALGWAAFLVAYLHLAAAVGAPVVPQPALQRLAAAGFDAPDLAATVFTIVVAAPLLEELVFRGYLFTALAAWLPRVAVHLLTALLFGLVHGPAYAVPIGVLALLFGWLRDRHGSLWPSVLAHALHNGLTVALVLLWPGHLDLLYPRRILPNDPSSSTPT